MSGRDRSDSIETADGLDGPGIESRWGGEIYRSCPEGHSGQTNLLYLEYRVFPGVRYGRGVTLNLHTLLLPRSKIE